MYEAGNRKINTSQGYLQSCLPCDVPTKQTDWIYIEGYPTLKTQEK
jgi:cytochrome c